MDKIKIALVDDEELFRKGILFLLQREENIEIVFEASNGQDLLEFMINSTLLPDIIMMDLKMPLLNGVEATKIINRDFPNSKVIALTSYNTKSFIANMIEVGASSYLIKSASPKEMIDTINEVAKKGFYYNENVLQVIQDDVLIKGKNARSIFDEDFLTNREKEVLLCICNQLSTVEIAEKLFLSARTVEGHRNNVIAKTQVKNVAGLVVFAIQNKIIQLNTLSLED
ncbi:response regulator [Flavobacterium sp.]|uniref:response regulator n=1 Tax=Flavobacterium sp. TaxID=239 RepID=UPI003752EAC3